eukprot:293103-Rhodomonas_salina.1
MLRLNPRLNATRIHDGPARTSGWSGTDAASEAKLVERAKENPTSTVGGRDGSDLGLSRDRALGRGAGRESLPWTVRKIRAKLASGRACVRHSVESAR